MIAIHPQKHCCRISGGLYLEASQATPFSGLSDVSPAYMAVLLSSSRYVN